MLVSITVQRTPAAVLTQPGGAAGTVPCVHQFIAGHLMIVAIDMSMILIFVERDAK
jgi:hypothetical protein